MEENLKQEFANYLSFLGILSKSTTKSFLNQIDSLSKMSSISFFQIISQSLALFLSKLTSEDFSQIALNVVLRYSRNKMQDYLQPLQRALIRNDKRNMVIVKRKYIKWVHAVYELRKKDPLRPKPLQSQSLSPKQQIQVPVILSKAKSSQSNSSFRSAKPLPCPFQSNFDYDFSQNTSKNTIMRIMNANRINNAYDYYCATQTQFDTQFLQRQNEFLLTKKRTTERVKKEIEEGAKSECTFSPKINAKGKRSLKRNKSTFERLYDDNFERQLKRSDKEQQVMELIRTEANNYNNKTQYDPKKIDELYEEYKVKEKKQKELVEKINLERAFPFAPSTNTKSKKAKNRNLSYEQPYNTSAQNKENLDYVLEYIKYKEGKDLN